MAALRLEVVGAAKAMAKRVLGAMKVNDKGEQSAPDAVLNAGDGVAGEELQWFVYKFRNIWHSEPPESHAIQPLRPAPNLVFCAKRESSMRKSA